MVANQSWADARAACRAGGRHVVAIETRGELQLLAAAVLAAGPGNEVRCHQSQAGKSSWLPACAST